MRLRIAAVLAVSVCLFTACRGDNRTFAPPLQQSHDSGVFDSGIGRGVQPPLANPTQLRFTALGDAQAKSFTIAIQFADDLVASSSNASIATVTPSTASPAVRTTSGGSKFATFTVTPTGYGAATITVVDKKGTSARIAVVVAADVANALFIVYGARSCGSGCIEQILNEVDVLPATATGQVVASHALISNRIDGPADVASAPDGTVWLANNPGSGGNLMAFAANAYTNPTPVATIGGPASEIGFLDAVALDARQDIYALSNDGWLSASAAGAILHFAAGSNGDVAPKTVVPFGAQTTLQYPADIAVFADGTLYVADRSAAPASMSPPSGDVAVFAPGANGTVAPIALLGGPNTRIDYPSALSLDAAGNLYVLSNDSYAASLQIVPALDPRVLVFGAHAQGDVAPVAVIEGPATGLVAPRHMRVDQNGGIYVADDGAKAVLYYAPGARGNIPPTRIVTTALAQLYGINVVGL